VNARIGLIAEAVLWVADLLAMRLELQICSHGVRSSFVLCIYVVST
jgi:hypothetical protein